jgi:hypothetical protein
MDNHHTLDKEHDKKYMFIGNLQTIKRAVDDLLKLDPHQLSEILKGHEWAEDHIATSKDDIEEVANFITNKSQENSHNLDTTHLFSKFIQTFESFSNQRF